MTTCGISLAFGFFDRICWPFIHVSPLIMLCARSLIHLLIWRPSNLEVEVESTWLTPSKLILGQCVLGLPWPFSIRTHFALFLFILCLFDIWAFGPLPDLFFFAINIIPVLCFAPPLHISFCLLISSWYHFYLFYFYYFMMTKISF